METRKERQIMILVVFEVLLFIINRLCISFLNSRFSESLSVQYHILYYVVMIFTIVLLVMILLLKGFLMKDVRSTMLLIVNCSGLVLLIISGGILLQFRKILAYFYQYLLFFSITADFIIEILFCVVSIIHTKQGHNK